LVHNDSKVLVQIESKFLIYIIWTQNS